MVVSELLADDELGENDPDQVAVSVPTTQSGAGSRSVQLRQEAKQQWLALQSKVGVAFMMNQTLERS